MNKNDKQRELNKLSRLADGSAFPKNSPAEKRSGFKMKKSPAKNYQKGYYGVK